MNAKQTQTLELITAGAATVDLHVKALYTDGWFSIYYGPDSGKTLVFRLSEASGKPVDARIDSVYGLSYLARDARKEVADLMDYGLPVEAQEEEADEKHVIVYHAAYENTTYKAAVVTVPGDMDDESAVMEAFRQTQNVQGSWSGPETLPAELTGNGVDELNQDYRESVTVVGGRRDLSKSQRGHRSTSMGDIFIVQGNTGGMRFYGLSLDGAVRFPNCGAFLKAKRPASPGDRMSAPYDWAKGVFA